MITFNCDLICEFDIHSAILCIFIDIILTVLVMASLCYVLWWSFQKRPFLSLTILAAVGAIIAIVSVQVWPELNTFLNDYWFVMDYISQHTEKVSIDVSFYVSLIGTIAGVIVGLNFSNDIIEQGLSMLLGCISTTFGTLCIYSANYYNGINVSILIITVALLTLGVCRRYYVPSERRLRYIAKLHAKRVWRQLEEKQKKKYEKLIQNATIKAHSQNNNLTFINAEVGSSATTKKNKTPNKEAQKSQQHSSRKQRKKAKKNKDHVNAVSKSKSVRNNDIISSGSDELNDRGLKEDAPQEPEEVAN